VAGLTGPDSKEANSSLAVGCARDEQGSTLVELLIATAIMGISVVVLLVGTSTLFLTSAANRQSTTSAIVARDYAEALDLVIPQGSTWCASSYPVVYTPPAGGYTASAVYGTCPAYSTTTPQFQTVTITATAPNGSVETLNTVVREP
jgi:type II secretory pathway pseudopilin PulG